MSIKTTITYYVTKYALTEGIWVIKPGDAEFSEDGRYLYVGEMGRMPIQVGPSDFFASLEEASARVEDLVQAKIKALAKQQAKLASYCPAIKEYKRRF